MMRKFFLPMLFLSCSLCFGQNPGIEADGSIRLPIEKQHVLSNYSSEKVYSAPGKNQDKIQSAGYLYVVRNKSGNSARMGLGSPIPIPGYTKINPVNAEMAAKAFISSRADLFRLGAGDELRLASVAGALGKYYINLKQYHDGEEVLLSKINLVISESAMVIAFTASLYDNISIDKTPVADESISIGAVKGLKYDKTGTSVMAAREYSILPIESPAGVIYYRVKRVDIAGGGINYTSFVNSKNAEPLWRINNIRNNINGKILSSVIERGGQSPVYKPAEDMNVTIAKKEMLTDNSGSFKSTESAPTEAMIDFQGKWARILYADPDDNSMVVPLDSMKLYFNLKPGKDTVIYLNDNVCGYEFRNCFQYMNDCHEYISKLDTGFKSMDYPMILAINYNYSPNGMADGETISLTGVNSKELFVAKSPMIVYHEYGHNINAKFYKWRGMKQGMINSSCNEALADLQAGLMLDEPNPTVGILPSGHVEPGLERDLRNMCKYPDSISFDCHMTGRILAGAFWDLRKTIGLDAVRKLTHFCRYNLPDDANDGMAFNEWFLATIIADDDDNNLSNGTPHYNEIAKAFGIHGIGEGLIISMNFRHDDVADIIKHKSDTTITIQCLVTPNNILNIGAASMTMKLRAEPDKNFTSYPMTAVNDSLFSVNVTIPNNKALVKYYFEGMDRKHNSGLTFFRNHNSDCEYDLLLGYRRRIRNNCESHEGWTNSTVINNGNVLWQIIKPKQFPEYPMSMVFPEFDHSDDGDLCFSTGKLDTLTDLFNHVVRNETSIITPEYDMSKMGTRFAARFFYWGFNENVFGKISGSLNFGFTTNGGTSWQTIDTFKHDAKGWERKTYLLDKYITDPGLLKKVKFRFMANAGPMTFENIAFTRFMIDDFEILSEEEFVGVEDEGIIDNRALIIYPNPVSDFIEIRGGNEAESVVICSLTGNVVLSQGPGKLNRIDISALPAGMYFIRIGGRVEKFVKM